MKNNTERKSTKEKGRDWKYTLPELEEKIEAYFEQCENHKEPVLSNKGEIVMLPQPIIPDNQSLAVFLDVTRKTVDEWSKNEEKPFCYTIKKAYEKISALKTKAMLNGKGSTTGLIFDKKVNEGWVDKQIVQHEGEIKVTLNLD